MREGAAAGDSAWLREAGQVRRQCRGVCERSVERDRRRASSTLGLTIDGTSAKTKATSESEVQGTGGACGPTDGAGFIIGGSVKDKAQPAFHTLSIHICLSTDTGKELRQLGSSPVRHRDGFELLR